MNYKMRNLYWITLFGLSLLSMGCQGSFSLSLPSAPQSPVATATVDPTFGVYFWGSTPTVTPANSKFATGISAITSAGFQTARIAMSSDSVANYGFTAPTCGTTSYLKCALENTTIGATLKASSLNAIIITAYDGASYANNNFINDTFMTNATNQAAITAEMKDFAYALFKDFSGSGKTFILSTWEGDNQIYCGQSYAYATSPTSKSSCDTYLSGNGFGNINSVVDAFTLWHSARKLGIQQARAQALADGLSGVTVLSGVEGNSLNLMYNSGYKSVFRDVVPVVQPDVVLYSSYETIDQGLMDRALTARLTTDLLALKLLIGSSQLFLGEWGFSDSSFGTATAQSLSVELVSAVRSLKASGVIQGAIAWELYENPAGALPGYGFFDLAGNARSVYQVLKSAFLGKSVVASPDIFMTALSDQGNQNTLTATAALYGSFPFSDITGVTSDCGISPVLTSQNGEILTFTFAATASNLSCKFQVIRSSGVSAWSAPFSIAGSPVINITAIAPNAPSNALTYLSIYGYFLTLSPITVTSDCAGVSPTVTYQSANQINIQFASSASASTCNFTASADGKTNSSSYNVAAVDYLNISALVIQSATNVVNISAYGNYITAGTGTITPISCAGAAATITHWDSGLINFSIPASTDARSCQFTADYGGVSSTATASFAVPANIAITGTGASAVGGGLRVVGLYGYFGSTSGTAQIVDTSNCPGPVSITYWSTTQVNVAVPVSNSTTRSCSFTLATGTLMSNASDVVSIPIDP